jgi:hypothetical protein
MRRLVRLPNPRVQNKSHRYKKNVLKGTYLLGMFFIIKVVLGSSPRNIRSKSSWYCFLFSAWAVRLSPLRLRPWSFNPSMEPETGPRSPPFTKMRARCCGDMTLRLGEEELCSNAGAMFIKPWLPPILIAWAPLFPLIPMLPPDPEPIRDDDSGDSPR